MMASLHRFKHFTVLIIYAFTQIDFEIQFFLWLCSILLHDIILTPWNIFCCASINILTSETSTAGAMGQHWTQGDYPSNEGRMRCGGSTATTSEDASDLWRDYFAWSSNLLPCRLHTIEEVLHAKQGQEIQKSEFLETDKWWNAYISLTYHES